MEHVSDKDRFWELAPAAATIFSYIKADPGLRKRRLEFEYAMVDQPSSRAVAKFACINCADCQHASIWVSAITQLDGNWVISHSVSSME